MNTFRNFRQPCQRRHQSGISLIIVMIMVVIIGLTSAAAIRNATSGERATNNMRMQNLAQQYAEAALRYCEAQVAKVDTDVTRVATLKDANIVDKAVGAAPGWNMTSSWVGAAAAGDASASRTTLPQTQIKSADSSVTPTNLPQCVAERQVLADGNKALILTARGFSPDYTFNAGTGATTGGSVVWLQSILLLQ